MNTSQDHWQSIYRSKGEGQTSWFRPRLDESLRLIDGLELHATPMGGQQAFTYLLLRRRD